MKIKNILTLIVAAGLTSFANRASAAIVELDLNDQSIYSSYSDNEYSSRNIELSFRFINGAFVTNLDYQNAINIKSQSGSMYGQSEIWAKASGTAAAAVSAGDPIWHTTTGAWVEILGYEWQNYGSNYQRFYGLGVSADPQYVGLYDNGYFGYAAVTIPNLYGRMTINKVAFNDVQNQHIFAEAIAIPEPSTYGLIGIAALGVAFAARRRKIKKAV